MLVAGLPVFRTTRLTDRVAPYLSGLGRVGDLVPQAHRAQSKALRSRLLGSLPAPSAALRDRLRMAGVSAPAESFRVEQMVWALVGCAGAMATGAGFGASGRPAVVVGSVGFIGGAMARDRLLAARIRRRREQVAQELPVALDLLTLSVMAGEAVPAAFERVGRLLQGEVGAEFRVAFGSMRAGGSLEDALASLPARLPHPALPRLVDALGNAVEHGSPVADALRAQADDVREARRRHLLEMGGRREVAMLVPVVFLILPPLIVFALFPGLVTLDLLVL